MSSPLVTFALFAYNQEPFIEEALEGAFAQQYSPLQIVLSDDCSNDRTYEHIQSAAQRYDGPAEVTLNRNSKNLGIGAHINRIMELAKGELIIAAAGDDVSFPERTAVLTRRWLDSEKRAMSLISGAVRIDREGEPIDEYDPPISEPMSGVDTFIDGMLFLGATHAWSRRVFEHFGPLRSDVVHEDQAIAFRSLLLGSLVPERSPLVSYRADVGVTRQFTNADIDEKLFGLGLDAQRRFLADRKQWYEDALKFGLEESQLRKIRHLVLEGEFLVSLGEKRVGLPQVRAMLAAGFSAAWIAKMLLLYKYPVTKSIKDRFSSLIRG